MTDNKLDQWLAKSGLIHNSPTPVPQPNTKPGSPQKQSSPNPKPTGFSHPKTNRPSGNHPPRKFFRPQEKRYTSSRPGTLGGKPFSPQGGAKTHTPRPVQKVVTPRSFSTAVRPGVVPKWGIHPLAARPLRNVGDIKVVPLGGVEQVGQNMLFIEAGDDIIILDTGIEFPAPEHLGIDVLIPDITYLIKNKKKIRGVIYTHGHLDHIGAAQYVVRDLGYPPMFATKLTKELLTASTDSADISKKYKITEINAQSRIKLGKFEVEFFHINHSIPDGVGIVVKTPYGSIVDSSDFKIDEHPSDEKPADLKRIAQIGQQGVALAMVDSTNALKPGHTVSESVIEKELEKIIKQSPARVVLATFASNIGRIGKIVEAAERDGRTVFLSGRSMERNLTIARKLNYFKCKDKTIQKMSKAAETMDPRKVLILSTGSQGEELAALTRMAAGVHRDIKLRKSDTVVFSSSPIPGNELAIVSVLNNLAGLEVKYIDNNQLDSHVSGHGHAEEVILMTKLLHPRFFAPIHGEMYMRTGHRDLAMAALGIPRENTFIMRNGQGIILNQKGARLMTDKEAIPVGSVMIEVGEPVHEHVLADRTIMAEGGAIFVSIQQKDKKIKDLNIRSRGLRYMNIKHEIFVLLEKEIRDIWARNATADDKEMMLQKSVQKWLLQKTKKEVLVEVVIMTEK